MAGCRTRFAPQILEQAIRILRVIIRAFGVVRCRAGVKREMELAVEFVKDRLRCRPFIGVACKKSSCQSAHCCRLVLHCFAFVPRLGFNPHGAVVGVIATLLISRRVLYRGGIRTASTSYRTYHLSPVSGECRRHIHRVCVRCLPLCNGVSLRQI